MSLAEKHRGESQEPVESADGLDGKGSSLNVGDLGLIPRWGRFPGEGNGYPLQYSCLENSMDREAWWITAHGVAKTWTQLSTFHTHFPAGGMVGPLTPHSGEGKGIWSRGGAEP